MSGPQSEPTRRSAPGSDTIVVPGYTIEGLIGTGGAGKVYKATADDTGQTVAIKVLHRYLSERPESARRQKREMTIAGTLDHPGIVRSLGSTVTGSGDQVAMIMEFVDGVTLRARLSGKAFPVPEALGIAGQIADILSYVHRKGVAHLDLKPENVLIVDQSRVRLMDFGIAQAIFGHLLQDGLKTQTVSGSVHYMAPEQFHSSADHRADLFALGVMIHEMMTGERPTGGILALAGRFTGRLLTELEALLGKLLEVDPARRYQTALDVREKLRRIEFVHGEEQRALQALSKAARPLAPVCPVEPPQIRPERSLSTPVPRAEPARSKLDELFRAFARWNSGAGRDPARAGLKGTVFDLAHFLLFGTPWLVVGLFFVVFVVLFYILATYSFSTN